MTAAQLNAISDGDTVRVDGESVTVVDACATQCYVKTEAGALFWVLHNSGRITSE